jgi:hypothetical protein
MLREKQPDKFKQLDAYIVERLGIPITTQSSAMNDYSRIAVKIDDILLKVVVGTHSPSYEPDSDSVTITKNAWIGTVVELGRLAEWAKGLAETHTKTLLK